MHAFLTDIYTAILPMLLELIGTMLGVVLLRLSFIAHAKFGLDIEAVHRDALQMAIMSGIRAALSRGLTGSDAVDAALAHAETSVPDAIAALKPATGVLASIATAKLKEATASMGSDDLVSSAAVAMKALGRG